MILNNTQYIKNTCAPPLAEQLLKKRDQLRSMGLKIKISQPERKLLPLKNYIFKETVYRSDHYYVSVVGKVYFGGIFDPKKGEESSPFASVFRFGRNRYVVYNKAHSLWWNIKNWYNRQLFEFVVKV